jgi:Ca2+-transporting ATPase
VLVAMVGIVDPPRAEAKAAIAECKQAGIRVRMITGDHAVTAGAIGRELGIEGRAITGAQFAAMPDEQAKRELQEIGVIARVAPEDKVRLVRLLQEEGNIVAMTGDGVNDAPALKKADIGVAMGITGTEVSKEAAVMILTDDNFATIVKAVHYGRGIYDNLMKYVRFQMSTLVAFILIFVLAGALNIAAGVPFTPAQILWINFAIDVPLAIALSYGSTASDLMLRKPRPVSAPPLTTRQWVLVAFFGAIMTAGTLAVWLWAEPRFGPLVAGSMMLATFSIYHVMNALGSHSTTDSAFHRESLNRNVALLTLLTLFLTFIANEMELFNRILGTVGLTFDQWFVCIAAALVLLVVDEVRKFFVRRQGLAAPAAPAPLPLTPAPSAGD